MNKPEITQTDTKNQYESKIKAFADDLDTKITEVEGKIKHLSENAKEQYHSKIGELKNKRQQLTAQLDRLDKTSDQEWNEVKSTFQSKATKLSKEISEAYSGITSGLNYLVEKVKDR